MRFRLIDDDHRRRRRRWPITLAQDHEWKCKLMGVAPVPEVIRIEAFAIDSGATGVSPSSYLKTISAHIVDNARDGERLDSRLVMSVVIY